MEKLVNRGLSSSKIHLSQLLNRMIISVASNLVLILGVLIALSQIGISLGPLLAGLGIAGFVIGFALQDTLSNFASGLMILFYRPFDVGDVVEAGGVFGKVNNMSLVKRQLLVVLNDNSMAIDVTQGAIAKFLSRVRLTHTYEDMRKTTHNILEHLANIKGNDIPAHRSNSWFCNSSNKS